MALQRAEFFLARDAHFSPIENVKTQRAAKSRKHFPSGDTKMQRAVLAQTDFTTNNDQQDQTNQNNRTTNGSKISNINLDSIVQIHDIIHMQRRIPHNQVQHKFDSNTRKHMICQYLDSYCVFHLLRSFRRTRTMNLPRHQHW
jgi:hypothetical protein